MLNTDLTLARLHVRAIFERQSILYHSVRGEIADQYYPEPFADWELDLKQVRLTAKKSKWRLYLDSGSVGSVADIPADPAAVLGDLADIITNVSERLGFSESIKRIGVRPVFLTERQSFEELFGHFRPNIVRHDRAWIQGTTRFRVTDLGVSSVIYGPPEDGMMLSVGVLTSEQATMLKEGEKFEYSEGELVVEAGALLVDVDRFTFGVNLRETDLREYLRKEFAFVVDFADTIRSNVLRG